MKFNKWTLGLLVTIALTCAGCLQEAKAQTIGGINISNLTGLLNGGFIQVGVPQTINGITFIATTNQSGGYNFMLSSAAGTVSNTPPTTLAGVGQSAQQMIAQNNPADAGFYGTNDITAQLGAVYLQSSGSSLISAGVSKFGLIKSLPQLAPEAELLQGTVKGVQSTAGGDALVDYRKVIGSVAGTIGAGGGYDAWAGKPFGLVKGQVELRINANLGTFVGLRYNFEGIHAGTESSLSGLGADGGVTGTF